ncbi:MAG: hypothetical protein AB7U35_09345 [Sphingobium sp.]
MTNGNSETSGVADTGTPRHEGAVCPFCGVGWTDAMLEMLDRFTMPSSCACCGGDPHPDPAPETEAPAAMEDICCTSCGRAIYRAVATSR